MYLAIAVDGLQEEHERLAKFRQKETHLNLVFIYEHGPLLYSNNTASPFYRIDMQFCDESLTNYISDSYERPEVDRGIPNEEVWEIIRQIASATGYLQREGIYQMEIKPKNGI